jgi:L-ascorbate metabolism protein UlaG (beta-lactamase superfamily)
MEITYLGHSCFKLKGKTGTVLVDPYDDSTRSFKLPKVSADVVTISHQHPDHNAFDHAMGTARREKPFLIDAPGEYEIAGISVFGIPSFHDAASGKERGSNIMYIIHMDDVSVAHLGDLGHPLDDKTIEQLGVVDVLLCPVGGVYTIDPKVAVDVIHNIEPSYIVPMHYKTPEHNQKTFSELSTVEDFLKAYGVTKEPVTSLSVNAGSMPEETELVVLKTA